MGGDIAGNVRKSDQSGVQKERNDRWEINGSERQQFVDLKCLATQTVPFLPACLPVREHDQRHRKQP